MKLRRLHIERYRAIRSLELSFLDPLGRVRPVTVLAGPNGSGKTSILIAIVQALRDVIGYRTDEVPPPDDDDVHRSGGKADGHLYAEPYNSLVKLDLELGADEQQAIQRAVQGHPAFSGEAALRPLVQGQIKLAWEYPEPLDADFQPQATPFQPEHASHWLAALRLIEHSPKRQGQRPTGTLFMFPQDRHLARHVSGESGASKVDPTAGPVRRGRRDADSVIEILRYLSTYVTQRDRPLPDSENPELRIRKQLQLLCPPIEYLGYRYQDDDPIGAPYFRNGPSGAPYPLSKAASGLQVILEYLVRLNYPRPLNHSLILIDEPEVHLHPSWARRLYLGLAQLGEDNQFILVTHSAEIRAMAAEDGALIDLGDLDDMDGQDVAPTAGVAEGEAASAADLPKDEDED